MPLPASPAWSPLGLDSPSLTPYENLVLRFFSLWSGSSREVMSPFALEGSESVTDMGSSVSRFMRLRWKYLFIRYKHKCSPICEKPGFNYTQTLEYLRMPFHYSTTYISPSRAAAHTIPSPHPSGIDKVKSSPPTLNPGRPPPRPTQLAPHTSHPSQPAPVPMVQYRSPKA